MFRGLCGGVDWVEVIMISLITIAILAIVVIVVLALTGVIPLSHDPNHNPIIICQKIGTATICNSY